MFQDTSTPWHPFVLLVMVVKHGLAHRCSHKGISTLGGMDTDTKYRYTIIAELMFRQVLTVVLIAGDMCSSLAIHQQCT